MLGAGGFGNRRFCKVVLADLKKMNKWSLLFSYLDICRYDNFLMTIPKFCTKDSNFLVTLSKYHVKISKWA